MHAAILNWKSKMGYGREKFILLKVRKWLN